MYGNSKGGYMAKLMIELQDTPNGMVAVGWNPTVQTIIEKHKSGHEITPAEGYLLSIATMIKEKSEIEAAKIRKDMMDDLSTDKYKHLLINQNL
jgi:hypothetical protein